MQDTTGENRTILLVEDDPTLADMLKDVLECRGYSTWHAANGAEAEAMVGELRPDLIIIDLMLPDANGLLLCAELKERVQVPIIICSATKRKEDSALAFKLGADDFVAKPFAAAELQARVEVALRRAELRNVTPLRPAPRDPSLQIGNLVIDHARCSVTLGDEPLQLTRTEYQLLCALAARSDEVVSREELAKHVWGYTDPDVARSLDVHISRLRSKLKSATAPAPALVTLRGLGYKLASDEAFSVASAI